MVNPKAYLIELFRRYTGYSSHDCIILFTDGETNNGITNAEELIAEYIRRMQVLKNSGRINNVQLAAITVDSYEPILLSKVIFY